MSPEFENYDFFERLHRLSLFLVKMFMASKLTQRFVYNLNIEIQVQMKYQQKQFSCETQK